MVILLLTWSYRVTFSESPFNFFVLVLAKARPSYPITALQSLRSELNLVPAETKVLDLAAGTGKFTELLVKEGYQVTAVEPVAEMRAKITENLPSVKAMEGTSWNIPVESESQDVVVIAQAFHWFDDVETLRECRRVLKPTGRLAFIWNMESQERSKWVAKLREWVELNFVWTRLWVYANRTI